MFYFPDLTEPVRALMLEEVKMDKDAGVIITSKRLTPQGEVEYPGLLEQAVKSHDPGWLAKMLDMGGRIKTQEPRIVRGRTQMVKVPFTAAQTLAEGEFNRFYIRALCRALLKLDPNAELEIYRAKPVAEPRRESEIRIGQSVKAAALLNDLRQQIGVDTALGVPAGPNSGLSVRIPVI